MCNNRSITFYLCAFVQRQLFTTRKHQDGEWKAARNRYCSRVYARADVISKKYAVADDVRKRAKYAAHKLAFDGFNNEYGIESLKSQHVHSCNRTEL